MKNKKTCCRRNYDYFISSCIFIYIFFFIINHNPSHDNLFSNKLAVKFNFKNHFIFIIFNHINLFIIDKLSYLIFLFSVNLMIEFNING